MRSRVLVAAVGVPLLLIVVLWAPAFFMAAALCVLAAVGGLELSHCVGGEGQVPLSWMSAVFAALTVSWCYAQPEGVPGLFTLMTLVVMAYGIVRGGAVKFDQLAAVLLSGVFIAWSFASFLRYQRTPPKDKPSEANLMIILRSRISLLLASHAQNEIPRLIRRFQIDFSSLETAKTA